ncbi:MAG: hypothetical protein AAFQ61_06455 [Cyanobacteria bacterium J06626_23]
MSNPLFWLGVSVGLLAVSLTVLMLLAIPALVGLARMARSAETLLEMLNRELPATLNALRQTGADLGELAEDVTGSVHSARQIVTQVDRSMVDAQRQVVQAHRTSRSLWAGTKAAWAVLASPPSHNKTPKRPPRKRKKRPPTRRPSASSVSTQPQPAAPPESRPPSQAESPQPTPAPVPWTETHNLSGE